MDRRRHAHLAQVNADTHGVLAALARGAGIDGAAGRLQVAGTKDKRAVTAQFVTAFKVRGPRHALSCYCEL